MQVIGHRGAAALAPENTWASFDRALSIGADAIETDVHSTSDGELVLIHDKNLSRTTDGSGVVHETPWSVVKGLDAGSWFSPDYAVCAGPPTPGDAGALRQNGPISCSKSSSAA